MAVPYRKREGCVAEKFVTRPFAGSELITPKRSSFITFFSSLPNVFFQSMKTSKNHTSIINHTLLACSAVFFLLGIFTPMVTFQKFWIFTDTYSLFSGTIHLLDEGNYFLFAVISSFSIAFPAFKIIILCQITHLLNYYIVV